MLEQVPFTLFALFPSVLNNLPKSGGWLNSVKVVLGFLELVNSTSAEHVPATSLIREFIGGVDEACAGCLNDWPCETIAALATTGEGVTDAAS